jgi:hypothetical protein
VLAETDVKERCRLVLRLIQERLDQGSTDDAPALKCAPSDWADTNGGWPPQFSQN